MKKGYAAFNLTEQAKQTVLSLFPAQFETVVAHHITYKFNVFENEEIPKISTVNVIGYAEDENAQAVVVEVDGTHERPDGGVFHITICHNEKVKPYYSNSLIAKGYKKITPFEISVKPTFNPF